MRDITGRFAPGDRKPLADRFWSKVDKDGPTMPHMSTPCWVWTGARHRHGYGMLNVDGKIVTAHRVAFFLEHGRWPNPFALHDCDHPPCVRHIREGTPADNMWDVSSRSRRVWQRDTCQKGHPMSTTKSGRRYCRVCSRENMARYGRARRLAETGSEATRVHGTETHCPHGHPYDEANTYRTPLGGRPAVSVGGPATRNMRRSSVRLARRAGRTVRTPLTVPWHHSKNWSAAPW
jgi:hypothetical protein